ncbi:hypothetical protein JXB02_04965 [Candidatus Woesearchaeota archaeon]|nr:hypothetical protein [Candidatus Woesearchaeota archaeon]
MRRGLPALHGDPMIGGGAPVEKEVKRIAVTGSGKRHSWRHSPSHSPRHAFGKRAVSPLIATVLLIAFAVALGAVVMNWGKSYVEEQAQHAGDKSTTEMHCQIDIDLRIKEIRGVPKICYDNTTTPSAPFIDVMLENRGTEDIRGIAFLVIDDYDNIFTNESIPDSDIPAGGVKKFQIEYDSSFGGISVVEITPMISSAGSVQPVLCAKNALVEDEVYECS